MSNWSGHGSGRRGLQHEERAGRPAPSLAIESYCFTSSTRRLLARPSAVVLSEAGLVSP